MVILIPGVAPGHGPIAIGSEILTKQTCQQCAHFVDDPAVIEAEIPGLTSFGSAYSSARGHAGICREFDRFLDPLLAQDCPSFTARDTDHLKTRPTSEQLSRPKE